MAARGEKAMTVDTCGDRGPCSDLESDVTERTARPI